jgi:hypothetical protein
MIDTTAIVSAGFARRAQGFARCACISGPVFSDRRKCYRAPPIEARGKLMKLLQGACAGLQCDKREEV